MLFQGYLVNLLLFTPIIIIALIFLSIFNKRYLATTRYYICNIIFLALFIPNNIYNYLIPIKTFNTLENKSGNMITKIFIETNQIFSSNKIITTVNNINDYNFSLKNFFIIVWAVGAFIYLFYQIVHYIYFRYKSFRWSMSITDENIFMILENAKQEQNIKTKINIRYSYFVTSPLLISCSHPTILLPNNIKIEYLNYIFRHELAHYKCGDLWLQRFRLIVQSLYWFNPIVWILGKRAEQEMERACDIHVLNLVKENQKKDYANTIFYVISLGFKKSQPLTTNFSKNKNEMYYRMEEIMSKNIRKKGVLLLLFISILLISVNIFIVYAKSTQKSKNISNTIVPIPLKDTLEELGFKIEYINKNFIKASNVDKKINFVNQYDYNLKKNKNTCFMEVSYDVPFITIGVLKELGYKIKENENNLVVVNDRKSIVIDTRSYVNLVTKNVTFVNEEDLEEYEFFNHRKVVRKNINPNEISDYKIEDVNLMGYSNKELEEYIDANYYKTLVQYKKELINIDEKHPSILNPSYDLMDNGLIAVLFNTSSGDFIKEYIIEVRNNEFFVEK